MRRGANVELSCKKESWEPHRGEAKPKGGEGEVSGRDKKLTFSSGAKGYSHNFAEGRKRVMKKSVSKFNLMGKGGKGRI